MENVSNLEIRTAIVQSGIPKFIIAKELGIADTSFSRKLRKEMTNEEKKKVLDVINRLSTSMK